MNKNFSDVKVLLWDFDGTFYKPNPKLFSAVRESEYRAIMQHTGWTREKTVEEFQKLHKVTIQSATAVIAKLCDIPVSQAAVESEEYFDRRKFLHRDEQLVDMFARLKKFRHIILANGIMSHHKETLQLLGIPVDTFEDFITAETVGITKPDPAGFLYAMKETGLPGSAHMMIGDRELVDLAPAKTLGMHTCLVWSETKSTIADVTLKTVYDVAGLFVK
jgi:HAD superfamily hydrolase (TIGR01549 family)